MKRWACALALAASLWASAAAAEPAEALVVLAAASTAAAIDEIATLFAETGQGQVRASYASSAALARQIELGSPADIFLSANQSLMDYLAERDLIDAASRRDLLSNTLVLVAPLDSPLRLAITPGFPLADALGAGRLAMGDPDHVPAGIYGREALRGLGVWNAVAARVAAAADVRGAMALVSRGEAAAGIVYASDARGAEGVRVLGSFPAESHGAIIYPVAAVGPRAGRTATAFLEFLRSPEAQAAFRRHGFIVSG
jgi:molybdate transport system substrate-binding protein